MIETTSESLAKHLTSDLGISQDDIVVLFSGVWGLGKVKGGVHAITDAFRLAIPDGILLVPTFSYNWCNGQTWDPKQSDCSAMGAYANAVWKQPDFVRTDHPNFSFAALKTPKNSAAVDELFDIDNTTFGEHSIFGNTVRMSRHRRAWILLLGGAFNDCLFRCTFVHYGQQIVNVPYRYEKAFYAPEDKAKSGRSVTQLVRYLSAEEYEQVNKKPVPSGMSFPVLDDFTNLGPDLEKAGLLVRRPYAYYESRMTRVDQSTDYFVQRLREDIYYCSKQVNPTLQSATL